MNMHDQGDNSNIDLAGRSIALAVQRKPPQLERELVAAVSDELARLGATCRIVEDGDARALDADDIWLISDGPSYVRYPWMLSRRSARPRTLLWQLHPLPPLEIGPDAERVGLAAAGVGHELRRSAERWIGRLTHQPCCRRWLNRLYWHRSTPGFEKSMRLMQVQPGWPWPDLDVGSVRGMMERDLWIREAVGERGWLDRVCVSTMGRAEFLRRRGIDAAFVPIGWHPMFGTDQGCERDVDVLFLGRAAPDGRRARLLEQIERRLSAEGFMLHRAESDCYGANRATMLNRARLVLNLNKYPWDAPWLRFVLAAGCGAVVVSEDLPSSDAEPWRAGTHYISAPPAELAQMLITMLHDPERIAAIRRAAGEYVSGPLTMSAAVRTLLNVATEA